jgi:hypothetical protein
MLLMNCVQRLCHRNFRRTATCRLDSSPIFIKFSSWSMHRPRPLLSAICDAISAAFYHVHGSLCYCSVLLRIFIHSFSEHIRSVTSSASCFVIILRSPTCVHSIAKQMGRVFGWIYSTVQIWHTSAADGARFLGFSHRIFRPIPGPNFTMTTFLSRALGSTLICERVVRTLIPIGICM